MHQQEPASKDAADTAQTMLRFSQFLVQSSGAQGGTETESGQSHQTAVRALAG